VLLLDEADSFLQDRQRDQRSGGDRSQ
jgi:hypothetical protein